MCMNFINYEDENNNSIIIVPIRIHSATKELTKILHRNKYKVNGFDKLTMSMYLWIIVAYYDGEKYLLQWI